MKRAVIVHCIFWAVVLFCSCEGGVFDNGVKFTDPKEVATLPAILEKHIDPEDMITKIQFRKGDSDPSNFSFDKGKIEIYYVDPEDSKKEIFYMVDVKKNEAYVEEWSEKLSYPMYNKKGYKDVKVSTLGCERIAEFVNAAIEIMAAENIDADGLGIYAIYPHSDPEKVKHEFTIEHISGGGSRTINYVDYSFKVSLKDGKLKYE